VKSSFPFSFPHEGNVFTTFSKFFGSIYLQGNGVPPVWKVCTLFLELLPRLCSHPFSSIMTEIRHLSVVRLPSSTLPFLSNLVTLSAFPFITWSRVCDLWHQLALAFLETPPVCFISYYPTPRLFSGTFRDDSSYRFFGIFFLLFQLSPLYA